MHQLIMWFLLAVCGSLAIGELLFYAFRNRKATDQRMPSLDDKALYQDDELGSPQALPGSPLPAFITASDSDNVSHAQWVLRLTRYIFNERHGARYNVVVINKQLEYHFNADHIMERHYVRYFEPQRAKAVPYEVVVFREGVLYNMGDGGDINWDWMGNFERSGNCMLTFRPCKLGVKYVQDPWSSSAPT